MNELRRCLVSMEKRDIYKNSIEHGYMAQAVDDPDIFYWYSSARRWLCTLRKLCDEHLIAEFYMFDWPLV